MRNFEKINFSIIYLPLFFLCIITLFLYFNNAMSIKGSFELQKELFLKINHFYANRQTILNNLAIYNFTQFGDAFTLMSFFTIFIVYAPKLWEVFISSSIISLIFSFVLKKLFKYPRPAAIIDNESFNIIGKVLKGHNSLPSGHSMTVFVILTVLLFAFMPQKKLNKLFWVSFILIIGVFLASTRIGVGAHFPLDVVVGCIIGYIAGVLGILFNQKYQFYKFSNNKKYYLFVVLILIASIIITIIKINQHDLIVYYFSLISLFVSLFVTIKHYAKN